MEVLNEKFIFNFIDYDFGSCCVLAVVCAFGRCAMILLFILLGLVFFMLAVFALARIMTQNFEAEQSMLREQSHKWEGE